jgi:hypothetical protein
MTLSFLDDLLKSIGNIGADTDKFMKREMPFDSGWGAPAAAVAAYFGGPAVLSALGEGGAASLGAAEGTGAAAGGGSTLGAGGMNGYLSSIGLEGGGSFAGQSAFQLPASAYTPEYLNMLANYQGVDAGNASYLDRLLGNTEQGLYKQEGLAKQASSQTASDMLKKRAQQSALSQLSKGGAAMQQQGQQSPQMQVPQAMMSAGKPIDTTTALLSLLREQEILRQPRISLI